MLVTQSSMSSEAEQGQEASGYTRSRREVPWPSEGYRVGDSRRKGSRRSKGGLLPNRPRTGKPNTWTLHPPCHEKRRVKHVTPYLFCIKVLYRVGNGWIPAGYPQKPAPTFALRVLERVRRKPAPLVSINVTSRLGVDRDAQVSTRLVSLRRG